MISAPLVGATSTNTGRRTANFATFTGHFGQLGAITPDFLFLELESVSDLLPHGLQGMAFTLTRGM